MSNSVPPMPPEMAERVHAIEGIKCHACYRKLGEGETWYEMQKTGAILCVGCMKETTTERVAGKGVV